MGNESSSLESLSTPSTVTGFQNNEMRSAALSIIDGMESDHYRRGALSRAARTVESDHYAAEFLKALTRSGADGADRQVFFDVIGTIESDHYRTEAVRALLQASDLTESDLIGLIAAIVPMNGDHYKSESLQAVARHRAANDRVRTAVIDAADRMSPRYREQVRRAAGRN